MLRYSDEDDAAEVDSALAPERRRPPLRPRRRGFDCRPSPEESEDPAEAVREAESETTAGSASSRLASAAVRPASSIRTRCFSPT
jgi:hypothetical protein